MPAPPTLKRRRDFLACARGRRWAAPALLLQARQRAAGQRGEKDAVGQELHRPASHGRDGHARDVDGIRVGYPCSKKLGNAVARNRAKRRLRAAAAEILPQHGVPGWDYVLVGRPEATVARPFPALLQDLRTAIGRVHARAR